MKVAIGSDHRGFAKKFEVVKLLEDQGHDVTDIGTHSPDPCDYPLVANRLAEVVSSGQAEMGILVCLSGIGMSIAANKTKGVRAALCYSLRAAKLSRQHNDANVLVLSADELTDPLPDIVAGWLSAPFEGGRHKRRLDQIAEIEKRTCR